VDDGFAGGAGDAEGEQHGHREDEREVVDREGEDATGVEEVEDLGLGAEFEAVAFECDGAFGGDGVFEGEEEVFGFVDPDEFEPLTEEGAEFFGVVGVADALADHEDAVVFHGAEEEAEEIGVADVERAEEGVAAGVDEGLEVLGAGGEDGAGDVSAGGAEFDQEGFLEGEEVAEDFA
jgi:hypothetical protein